MSGTITITPGSIHVPVDDINLQDFAAAVLDDPACFVNLLRAFSSKRELRTFTLGKDDFRIEMQDLRPDERDRALQMLRDLLTMSSGEDAVQTARVALEHALIADEQGMPVSAWRKVREAARALGIEVNQSDADDAINRMTVMPFTPARNVWFCKIGYAGLLPPGADAPMRQAIEKAFWRLTASHPEFCFSGWGGSLTKGENDALEQSSAPPPAEAPRGRRWIMVDPDSAPADADDPLVFPAGEDV